MIDELDPHTEWVRVQEVSLMGARYVQDGKAAQVVVNGIKICLVRRGEELFALRDRCPHAGAPLHQGQLDENGHLVCPWHRFKFCIDNGKSAAGEGFAVEAFAVKIEEDGTYVGFPRQLRKKWWGIF